MANDLTVLELKQYKPKDPRLGRHVAHDSRSLRFKVVARDPMTLSSVRHVVNIPILDQENLGSCTGHAATAAVATAAHWNVSAKYLADIGEAGAHRFAVGVYSDATKIDPWPGEYEPDDTGSDGLSVAKVLKNRGLVSGYEHATSLNAALTALAKGVVIIGSVWMSDMYGPSRAGQVVPTGYEEGGHEYALDELDVANQRVWIRNSWGTGWGIQGRAWLTWADLGKLLANYGDCTSFTPMSAPPPVPTPVEPSKPTVTGVVTAEDAALMSALDRIIDNKNAPTYLKGPAKNWLATKRNG